jgi:beta-N-acetylhexosaminidase
LLSSMKTPPATKAASLEAMTSAASLGQMIITGFSGTQANDAGVIALRERAECGHVGGVILFGYNIEGTSQLKALVRHIRSWQTPAPLLIAIDQEGGAVQRLRPNQGFHGWPSPHALSTMPSSEASGAMHGLARELQDFGINFNFAPCLDLHDAHCPIIGALGRSYGSEPHAVTTLALEQISALKACGVATAVKHFPGHGSARGDTHRGLTDVTMHWRQKEREPFEALIAANAVDAVMTSHLVHRGLDPSGDPVTFSRPVVYELLRGTLGYEGLVVSDDLGMGALVHDYGLPTIIERTVASGHDLLIFGQNAAAAGRGEQGHRPIDNLLPLVVETVRTGIEAKTIHPAQLERSLNRIANIKMRFVVPASPKD